MVRKNAGRRFHLSSIIYLIKVPIVFKKIGQRIRHRYFKEMDGNMESTGGHFPPYKPKFKPVIMRRGYERPLRLSHDESPETGAQVPAQSGC
jgi:hypothetical protein